MPKPKVCNGAGVAVAFSWVAEPTGSFVRYMVRHCKLCKQSHVSTLVYVDPAFVLCPACLGQRLDVHRSGDRLHIKCFECKQLSSFEADDEGFDLGEDDDFGPEMDWDGPPDIGL